MKLKDILNRLKESMYNPWDESDPRTSIPVSYSYDEISKTKKYLGGVDGYVFFGSPSDEGGVFFIFMYKIQENGVYDNPLAFCKFSSVTIEGRKYIDIILLHNRIKFGGRLIPILLDFMSDLYKEPFIDNLGSHSNGSINLFKYLSGKRKVYWLNINTGEKSEYDGKTDKPENLPYRSLSKRTEWRIVIENDGNVNVGEYPIYEHYLKNAIMRGVDLTKKRADVKEDFYFPMGRK